MKYLLMIPGPVEISDDILEAFQGQTVAHYGQEFRDLYVGTTKKLSKILGSKGKSFLIPGSGSTSLETIAATFCSSKKCLILNNGFFGDRLYDIVSKYTFAIENKKFSLGETINLNDVRQILEAKKFDIVLMTHVDTSVGILNPIREVASIAKEHGALFFVDAIASSGIEMLQMDKWDISAVVTATQKGFGCPPGLGMVTVQESLLNNFVNQSPKSWYLDLRTWVDYYKKWNSWHPYPVTLPTNLIKALARSLDTIESIGIAKRVKMFEEVSMRLRKSLKALGLELFVPEGFYSHGLTSVHTIGKFNSADLVLFLKKKLKIQIAGSLGSLQNVVFRIGHMSEKQCQNRNLIAVIGGIGLYMNSIGLKASIDEAISELIEY